MRLRCRLSLAGRGRLGPPGVLHLLAYQVYYVRQGIVQDAERVKPWVRIAQCQLDVIPNLCQRPVVAFAGT